MFIININEMSRSMIKYNHIILSNTKCIDIVPYFQSARMWGEIDWMAYPLLP